MSWAVIGASSFYGSAFVRLLQSRGEQVFGLARPEYNLVRTPGLIIEALYVEKPRYVVNFAALNVVAESWKYSADYYRTNIIGVTTVAEGLLEAPWLERFVQVSTPEVYGSTGQKLKPGQAYRPSTPYAVSRAAADMHLEALWRQSGFPVTFTRTVNIYGAGQQAYRIIPRAALTAAFGGRLPLEGMGVSERSFIHVDDAAEAVRLVAERGREGQTYHVATERMTKIADLVRMVCAVAKRDFDDLVEHVPERPGKDMAYLLDDSATRKELGWADRILLEDGVADTVRWYMENAGRYAGRPLAYEHRP